MFSVERNEEYIFGPFRWRWVYINTAYGCVAGYAWTKRQAYNRLVKAQNELLDE